MTAHTDRPENTLRMQLWSGKHSQWNEYKPFQGGKLKTETNRLKASLMLFHLVQADKEKSNLPVCLLVYLLTHPLSVSQSALLK